MAHFVFYDLPQDVKDKITDLRAEMAANRYLLSGYRLSALLAKANFNPNQPRVPAGNPDGGEWTRVPGWAKPRTRDADGDTQPRPIPAVFRVPASGPRLDEEPAPGAIIPVGQSRRPRGPMLPDPAAELRTDAFHNSQGDSPLGAL